MLRNKGGLLGYLANQYYSQPNFQSMLLTLNRILYDCGFCIVTWEQGGETMNGEFKFGNKYAIDGLVSDSFSILLPETEKEEAEDVSQFPERQQQNKDGKIITPNLQTEDMLTYT